MAVVTVADYRLRSGDLSSPYTFAERLIEDATGLVEVALGRYLESAQRTETLLVHPDTKTSGQVWPRAYPVAAVTTPSGATIEGDEAQIIRVTADLWSSSAPLYEAVLYTGGYASVGPSAAPENDLPVGVRHAIIQVAYAIRAPSPLATYPFAATSVSLGDVSVRFGTLDADTALAAVDLLAPGAAGLLVEHRHPRSKVWGVA